MPPQAGHMVPGGTSRMRGGPRVMRDLQQLMTMKSSSASHRTQQAPQSKIVVMVRNLETIHRDLRLSARVLTLAQKQGASSLLISQKLTLQVTNRSNLSKSLRMARLIYQMCGSSLSNSRTHHHRANHVQPVTARVSEIRLLIPKANCQITLRTREVLKRKPQFPHLKVPHQCRPTIIRAKILRCTGRLRASWLKRTRHNRWIGEQLKRLTSVATTSLGI